MLKGWSAEGVFVEFVVDQRPTIATVVLVLFALLI
jgi:hypothetical protein